MSKQIRLSDPTYLRLESIREKRETFSQAIERMLDFYIKVELIAKTLGPSHYLMERPKTDAATKESDNR